MLEFYHDFSIPNLLLYGEPLKGNPLRDHLTADIQESWSVTEDAWVADTRFL